MKKDDAGLLMTCDCGEVHLHVNAKGVKNGTRIICYCNACRGADLFLRETSSCLTKDYGIGVLETSADRVSFPKGQDKLSAIRVSSHGPVRWYASCCGTPLINGLSSPRMPWVGVVLPASYADNETSPVRLYPEKPYRVHTKLRIENKNAPEHDYGFIRVVAGIGTRILTGTLRGLKTPFLNDKGKRIGSVRALNSDERKRLYSDARDLKRLERAYRPTAQE